MKKCIIWILLVVILLSACATKQAPETSPTEATQLTSPTEISTEPADSPTQKDRWYAKVDMENWYFDSWLVTITEWKDSFYYIADGNLNRWDIATETEELLVCGDVRGIFVYEDRFYYYTDLQIYELDFGIDYLSVLIWELPDSNNDASAGICGLMIHDGWFYIKDSGISAVRYDPKTGITEDFIEDFSHLVFLDERCYYTDHAEKTFSIYEFDTQSKESSLVRGDGNSKRYGSSIDLYFDELRSVNGQLYFVLRESEEFFIYNETGVDKLFMENAWIQDSYIYPNLCYSVIEGNKVNIYEADETGKAALIASLSKNDIYIGMYNSTCFLVTESAVFYKADEDAPLEIAWKNSEK